MGYSPVGQETKAQADKTSSPKSDSDSHTGHFLKTEVLIKIAKAAASRNDYQTGIECYEKVIELEPNHSEAGFLLKRTKYMVKDETEPKTEKTSAISQDVSTTTQTHGMLPQLEARTISIKPKQKMEVNPNIIIDKVHVDGMENGKDMENMSRNVARKSKGSIMGSRGVMIVMALTIALIMMIVGGLWWFGFLNF